MRAFYIQTTDENRLVRILAGAPPEEFIKLCEYKKIDRKVWGTAQHCNLRIDYIEKAEECAAKAGLRLKNEKLMFSEVFK